MYLHRYPHTHRVYKDMHIPRQCTFPPHQPLRWRKKKSQSQLFSRFYNLRSSKSQMWGFNTSNQNVSYYNVLNDCIQAFPRCTAKTTTSYFTL